MQGLGKVRAAAAASDATLSRPPVRIALENGLGPPSHGAVSEAAG